MLIGWPVVGCASGMAPGGPAGAPPSRSTRLEPCPWALGDVGMQIGMCRAWNARFSDLLGIYLGKSFIIIIRDNYFHLRPVLQRLQSASVPPTHVL